MEKDERELMKEIIEIYPDYYNPRLPASVWCPPPNGDDEELRKPFIRTLPKYFKINNIEFCKRGKTCLWRVAYSLKDGSDLPEEPDLRHIISYLLRYAPLNTVILKEERELVLPKCVNIPYEVFCNCPVEFLDVAANPPQMQLLKERFQVLQV